MMKTGLAAVLAALAIAFAVVPQAALARDKTIDLPSGDVEMAAAIAKARSTLSEFWKAKDAPSPGIEGFALKVAIPYGENSREHFWLSNIQRNGDKYSGVIDNDPKWATHVSKGQRYEFTEADISDWLFMRNGKMVGNETMRPLMKRMPKELADQYREMYETP